MGNVIRLKTKEKSIWLLPENHISNRLLDALNKVKVLERRLEKLTHKEG